MDDDIYGNEIPMGLVVGAAICLVFIILWVMSESYEDEVLDEKAYCENVADGTWPDYKEVFEEWCN